MRLVANGEVGLVVRVVPVAWLLAILVRGTIHRPVQVHLWPHTIVQPWYMMVQLILVKGNHASSIAHCDNGEEGVRRQAGNDVGCSSCGQEI